MAIKADLIKFTRDELGITHEQATKYVEAEINYIKDIMKKGDKLVISNFGTFKTVKRESKRHYSVTDKSMSYSSVHLAPQMQFAKSFKKEIRNIPVEDNDQEKKG